MSSRQRTSLVLTGLLLILSLGGGILAAHATVGALRSFQQQSQMTKEGDVQTIRDWMTVPYISRVYHVPAPYLYQSLQIPATHPLPHVTLQALATHNKKPVTAVIHNVQSAILQYRKSHRPVPRTFTTNVHRVPGRTSY